MKGVTGLVCLTLGLAITGCAPRGEVCPLSGQTRADTLRLYFGRDIPGGGFVSDADWSAFAAAVLTPAFPEGFSVYNVLGQWRLANGSIKRERSFVLERVGAIDAAKVATITEAYRTRYHQESVGVVTVPVCSAF